MIPSSADIRRRRRLSAAAGSLAFVVASVTLLSQTGDPFWIDELHSVWTAQAPLGELTQRASLGNQSPLYFPILALVGRLFGYDPLAMRAISALAGAAAIALTTRYVVRTTGSLTVAAGLVATALTWPTLLFYFTEARPYALVFLAATVTWIGLATAIGEAPTGHDDEKDGATARRRILTARLAWIAGLASAIWLHPTALLLLPAVVVILFGDAIFGGARSSYALGGKVMDVCVVLVLCTPAAPLWSTLYARRGAWNAFIVPPTVRAWIVEFDLAAYVAVPLIAGMIAAACAIALRSRTFGESRFLSSATAFACGFAIPVAVASFATWIDVARVYHFRYLIGAVAALPAYAGVLLGGLRPGWYRVLAAGALVATSLWMGGGAATLVDAGRLHSPRRENWASLATRVAQLPPGPIVLDADVIESVRWADSDDPRHRQYLAFPLSAFPELDGRAVQSISYRSRDPVRLTDQTLRLAEETGRLYAVARGGDGAPAKMQRRLRGRLPKGFDRDPTVESFGRVWLFSYERSSAD